MIIRKDSAGYELPSETKTEAELLYYKLNIFERLFPFYATVGLIMLIGLITMVIKGIKETSMFVRILGWLAFCRISFPYTRTWSQMVYCRSLTNEQWL